MMVVLWEETLAVLMVEDRGVAMLAVEMDRHLEETLEVVAVLLANFDECKIQIIAESMFYIFFSYFSPYLFSILVRMFLLLILKDLFLILVGFVLVLEQADHIHAQTIQDLAHIHAQTIQDL
jgi:hypothetical protein